jgi:hypothetical protein
MLFKRKIELEETMKKEKEKEGKESPRKRIHRSLGAKFKLTPAMRGSTRSMSIVQDSVRRNQKL